MQIEHYYCVNYDKPIYDELIERGIKVTIDDKISKSSSPQMIFKVYTTKEDELNSFTKLVTKYGMGIRDLVFSKKELSEANWLLFRSTNMKLESLSEKTIELGCRKSRILYYHTRQVAPYALKPIKWKNNNHFYSSYEGAFKHIFCDDYARALLEKQEFKGLNFGEVLWAHKNISLPDAHQLIITNPLSIEAVLNLDDTVPSHCPICGKKNYDYNHNKLFRIEIDKSYLDESQDFYETDCDFTIGFSPTPFLICSQRVYSFLTSMNLTRNLCFEPLIVK